MRFYFYHFCDKMYRIAWIARDGSAAKMSKVNKLLTRLVDIFKRAHDQPVVV